MMQAAATGVICAWAFVTMFGLFSALKAMNMLRVSEREEIQALETARSDRALPHRDGRGSDREDPTRGALELARSFAWGHYRTSKIQALVRRRSTDPVACLTPA